MTTICPLCCMWSRIGAPTATPGCATSRPAWRHAPRKSHDGLPERPRQSRTRPTRMSTTSASSTMAPQLAYLANGTLMARHPGRGAIRRRPSVRKLSPTWAFALERMTGIEPALSAWEADVLPLNYIRSDARAAWSGQPGCPCHHIVQEQVACLRAPL
jgi:hypothetical protein